MYQPLDPSAITVSMVPSTVGKPTTGSPLPASIGTPDPVAGPTWLKFPPM